MRPHCRNRLRMNASRQTIVLRAGLLCPLLAATFALAGCGSSEPIPETERTDITGTITLDGKPLAEAEILFVPLEGDQRKGTMLAFSDADGKYSMPQVAFGEYQVRVDRQVDGGPNPALAAYQDESELRAAVEAGNTQFDFDLKSAGN